MSPSTRDAAGPPGLDVGEHRSEHDERDEVVVELEHPSVRRVMSTGRTALRRSLAGDTRSGAGWR